MTARFERLSIIDGTILASMLAVLAIFLLPSLADASVQNKTTIIFEIKNLTIKIPEIPTIQFIADLNKDAEIVEIAESNELAMVPTPVPVPPPALAQVKSQATNHTPYQIPPKKMGADRVYMHEPEIRAYVCPKLGDKCNIFIAILKAENGTHECTRDNRGLNRNGSIDIGLTQINWTPSSPYTFEQLQDCKFNLDIALQKYATRGFQPWAAYNSGRYLRHMPAVLASAQALEAAAAVTTSTEVVAASVN
ncbi:MAG: hypothetical protein KW793_00270 [Candidatus Doudnabacteria bacterium]|nr:hypothetical protein [Candidatus Doudnabacteria bacterium]